MKVELNFKELAENILGREIKKFDSLEVKELLKRRLTKKEYKITLAEYQNINREETKKDLLIEEDRYEKLLKSARKKIFENL